MLHSKIPEISPFILFSMYLFGFLDKYHLKLTKTWGAAGPDPPSVLLCGAAAHRLQRVLRAARCVEVAAVEDALRSGGAWRSMAERRSFPENGGSNII